MTKKTAMEAASRILLIVGIFKIVVGLLIALVSTLIIAFSLLNGTPN